MIATRPADVERIRAPQSFAKRRWPSAHSYVLLVIGFFTCGFHVAFIHHAFCAPIWSIGAASMRMGGW